MAFLLLEPRRMVTSSEFFQAQSFCLLFCFSFIPMLYVISLAKTSVTYNEAVNPVSFLKVLLYSSVNPLAKHLHVFYF